jgi:hypothetical protein
VYYFSQSCLKVLYRYRAGNMAWNQWRIAMECFLFAIIYIFSSKFIESVSSPLLYQWQIIISFARLRSVANKCSTNSVRPFTLWDNVMLTCLSKTNIALLKTSAFQTALFTDLLCPRKIATDPHNLVHVNIQCRHDRYPELKICISERT